MVSLDALAHHGFSLAASGAGAPSAPSVVLWSLVFVGLAGLVGFTFVGYPLVLWLYTRLRPAPRSPTPANPPPTLSIVLSVYNEGERLPARLDNLLTNGYPTDRLEIVVVSDGSTDDSVARVEALGLANVKAVARSAREGKATCLNVGLGVATGDLVVFADARQTFAEGTLERLAAAFADPAVGAVSGRLTIATASSTVGAGVDLYWRLESLVRRCEAQLDSCIGCTGAIYAIRRSAWRPLPADTILDDVVTPMSIALQGYRVLYEPDAVAYDPQASDPARESIRKRRTLAGNFQMLARHPGWLAPWRNRLVLQLIAHKYLRLLAPLMLLGMLLANIRFTQAAAQHGWGVLGWGVLAAHLAFYALAATGLAFPGLRLRLLSIPAGFVFLNYMTIRGLLYYLSGQATGTWQTQK